MKKHSFKLSLSVTYFLLILSSLLLSLLLFLTQPDTNTNVFALIIESRGLTFLLNWLPIALVMLFLFFISGRLILAAGLGSVVFLLPSVVNRYMVALRFAPLQPLDVLLGAEFLGIAKSISLKVYIAVGLGAVVFVLIAAMAFFIVRNEKPERITRLAGALLCVVLFAVLFFTTYKNEGLYESLPMRGNRYSEANRYQSRGFVYSFIHALHSSSVTRPDGYNENLSTVLDLIGIPSDAEKSAGGTTARKLPHIVFVQGEAFSELSSVDTVNFDGFDDPLSHYNEIKAKSTSGYIVSPHFGGGTSDMEFDVLTGMNTRALQGVPYTFTLIKKPFAGVASVLKQNGYGTTAMHPGAGWFYNRKNVYPLLGFDAFIDDTGYDTTDTKGLYITERQTADKLIEEFEARTNTSDAPQFLFCITIQNHGPYYQKYFKDGRNFNTDLTLNEYETNSLANYFEGVKDADTELGRMAEYFAATGEPVVLVYFGDHMPSFEPDLLAALDPLPDDAPAGEQMLKYNRLPFLIWTNEAAKPLINTGLLEESLPGDRTMSAHYLGAAVLQMAGISGDNFLGYVNGMRPDYPVVLDKIYRPAGEKDMVHIGDGADDKPIDIYNSWSYYRCFS